MGSDEAVLLEYIASHKSVLIAEHVHLKVLHPSSWRVCASVGLPLLDIEWHKVGWQLFSVASR